VIDIGISPLRAALNLRAKCLGAQGLGHAFDTSLAQGDIGPTPGPGMRMRTVDLHASDAAAMSRGGRFAVLAAASRGSEHAPFASRKRGAMQRTRRTLAALTVPAPLGDPRNTRVIQGLSQWPCLRSEACCGRPAPVGSTRHPSRLGSST
jgi:hypothetical protein